mmetsp:Transcript_27891/g.41140  ORF Transcript_27891/g.41140 Transcript_27891/m.41140 type:complete len:132 (-) Transcript_27891:1290-1685(-)
MWPHPDDYPSNSIKLIDNGDVEEEATEKSPLYVSKFVEEVSCVDNGCMGNDRHLASHRDPAPRFTVILHYCTSLQPKHKTAIRQQQKVIPKDIEGQRHEEACNEQPPTRCYYFATRGNWRCVFSLRARNTG